MYAVIKDGDDAPTEKDSTFKENITKKKYRKTLTVSIILIVALIMLIIILFISLNEQLKYCP